MPNNTYTERSKQKKKIDVFGNRIFFFIPVCHLVLRLSKREEVKQILPAATLNLNNYFSFLIFEQTPRNFRTFLRNLFGKHLMRLVSVGRLWCYHGNQFLTGSL